jgi:hypothetical protein
VEIVTKGEYQDSRGWEEEHVAGYIHHWHKLRQLETPWDRKYCPLRIEHIKSRKKQYESSYRRLRGKKP